MQLLNAKVALADTTTTAAPVATTAATTSAPIGAAPGAPAAPSTLMTILPFALMFAVFYFLMIRPQQKKMKDQQNLLSSLQKGEEVITASGIFGKVHGIAEQFITLEVDNNVRIKVLRSQISTVLRGGEKKALA
ncbi:MAG: preprotein translocase subunit YajC [Proteobacteria bacterium]|nr:MAG: preprotein translocase subunit YajC [Pseudomonadota bacterium]